MPIPDLSEYFCRLSGYLIDLFGRPLQNFKIKVDLKTYPGMVSTVGVMRETTYISTDSAGYLEVDLLRGATYMISFQQHNPLYEFVAPDQETADLMQAINPWFESIEITYE